MALLGDLVVKLGLDSTNMTRGLNTAKSKVSRFVSGLGVRLKSLAIDFVKVSAAATAAFAVFATGFAIKKASQLEETMNKFNVVFGDAATATKQWGDEFAKQVGRSRQQIASFLSGTQDLLVPAGLDPGAALDMSKTITKLAVDVASFNTELGITDRDVLRDFHAALTGGGETVKKYGVILNVATTQAELLRQGINPKEATEAQKVFARFNVLLAGTTAAQGDALRSAGSFANQYKRFTAAIDDLAASLGTSLLPLFTRLVSKLASMVEWIDENERATGIIGRTMNTVFKGIGEIVGLIADRLDMMRIVGVAAFTTIAAAAHTLIGSIEGSLRAIETLFNGLAKIARNPLMQTSLATVAPNLANVARASDVAFGGNLDIGGQAVGELRQKTLGIAVAGANDVEATITRMNEQLTSGKIRQFFNDIQQGASGSATQIGNIGKSLTDISKSASDGASLMSNSLIETRTKAQELAEQFQMKLESRADQIFENTRTASERYDASVAEIRDLFARGLISGDTALRAVNMERNTLLDSFKTGETSSRLGTGSESTAPKLGAATTRGSREAYSTIANASLRRAMTPSQAKAKEEAAKKQRQQMLEAQRQAVEYLKNLDRKSDKNRDTTTLTRIPKR